MVDSSPPQNLTLNSSEITYYFPPHRRRPLPSRTYGVLAQILSHCRTASPQLKLQVDSGDIESNPVSKKDGPITHNEANADVIVPFPNTEGSKNMIIQEDSNDKNKENTGSQDGGFDGKQATIPKLHHATLATGCEPEVAPLVTGCEPEVASLVTGCEPEVAPLVTGCEPEVAPLVTGCEPEVAPSNIISVEDYMVVENLMGDCAIQNTSEQENLNGVHGIQMDDFEVDTEFCIDNFNEVFDSCFGMDVESSKGQESQDKETLLENTPNDAEQELQLKEMELEKLVHNSGGVESSFTPNADEEMEEGEISGEAGVAGESSDALSDDAASLEKGTTGNMHSSKDHFENEEHLTFDRVVVNMVNDGSNSMKIERRAPSGQMQDCLSQNVLHDNHTETQKSGAITPCFENLTPRGRIPKENAAENQIPSTTENGDCASTKKRKRGPLTEERREKKKKSKRLKRAKKNRELGVKRLKLQPVFKEKKIVYCRHYLQGRCHEGDKCKFSHDTVPLTKSKPCSHFARHSCMKGDDCPFDHQLSNYPCTNYASNGFCVRGSDCLFSHEIPAKSCSITPNVSDKGGSDSKSKVTRPEQKFLSPLNNSNSSKHMDHLRVLNQKVDAIICPAKAVPRTGVQPPRGVSFLSNKGKSVGDTNKDKRDESFTKTPEGVNIGSKSILNVPSGIIELNKVSEGTTSRKPRGINFLSFGQTSTDDSSHRIISNLLSNCNNVADKPVIDDSISKETASVHVNRSDASSSVVKEKESTSKLQGTFKSHSLSFWDQSTGGQNANSSSPFKKSLFSNTSSLVHKAVQSTLSFAAQFEPDIKVGSSHRQWER